MKLIIASSNAHKLVEIREILGGHFEEIVSLREAGIDHETVEDGQSFLENARKKAREITELTGCCALADVSTRSTARPVSSRRAFAGGTAMTRRITVSCSKSSRARRTAARTTPAPSCSRARTAPVWKRRGGFTAR